MTKSDFGISVETNFCVTQVPGLYSHGHIANASRFDQVIFLKLPMSCYTASMYVPLSFIEVLTETYTNITEYDSSNRTAHPPSNKKVAKKG